MLTISTRSTPTRAPLLFVVGLSALVLTACTTAQGDSATAPSADEQGTSAPVPSNADGGGTGGDMNIDSLLTAGKLALSEVPDSTLTSIETEQFETRWEVQVVIADGTEYQMDISADGSEVLTGPTAEDDSGDDKAEHQTRVAAATLDFQAAAERMLETISGGTITELNLDDEAGTTVWEGDVIDGSGVKHEVQLHAADGSVLRDVTDG